MAELANNRKAYFNYEILETVEAGIQLTGSEVKSLRAGKVNIGDSYAIAKASGMFLINCHIAPYDHAGYMNHEPMRERKLLLHQKEIDRLMEKASEKGLTLVALKLYFKGPWVKALLGVGRGKKSHDKRDSIKRREADRLLS